MDLQALSREYGFAACYVFTTEPFVYYERRLQDGALHSAGTDLSPDLKKTAPWANVIVALLYPYRPYADEIPVSGNYPTSNAAFHASNKLMKRLRADGVKIEREYVPIRELLTRSGIGTSLKNGLTYIPGFGTRYAVQTLAADLPEPSFTPTQTPAPARCPTCHACERICPSGAISENGYDYKACARAY